MMHLRGEVRELRIVKLRSAIMSKIHLEYICSWCRNRAGNEYWIATSTDGVPWPICHECASKAEQSEDGK